MLPVIITDQLFLLSTTSGSNHQQWVLENLKSSSDLFVKDVCQCFSYVFEIFMYMSSCCYGETCLEYFDFVYFSR